MSTCGACNGPTDDAQMIYRGTDACTGECYDLLRELEAKATEERAMVVRPGYTGDDG